MIKNKIIALFFVVIVLFALAFSVSFIIHESGHNCIGESCRVCALVAAVNETVSNISSAVLACALALALIYIGYKYIFCFVDNSSQGTPVVLKVKLLN